MTRDVLDWPELAGSEWTTYSAAVAFGPASSSTIGFRYLSDGSGVPTFVGGTFLVDLRRLRGLSADPSGALPNAALVRAVGHAAPVQVRFIADPAAAAQITWSGVDTVIADNLRGAPAPVNVPSVVLRPAPDLLDASALVSRIRADIAASLRGVEGWYTFGLGVDVARNRAAGFLYDVHGTPQQFVPILSPLDDLAELQAQTGRPDGTKWAGATIQAWAASSEIVLQFYDDAGITTFLGQGPDAAGAMLRPASVAPAAAPGMPWPPEGGYLDRNALLSAVASAVVSAPALAGGDWDRFAVVIRMDGPRPAASALRYYGEGPAIPTEIPAIGPVGKLRRATRSPDGALWDVCVLRGMRTTGEVRPDYRYGAAADDVRVDASTIQTVADALRPHQS